MAGAAGRRRGPRVVITTQSPGLCASRAPCPHGLLCTLGKGAEECHARRVPGNEGGPLSFADPAASAPSIRAGTGWHWRRRRRHPGAWPQSNHWDSNKGNAGPGGRERGSGKEEPLPEGIDLCAHFDPATIFMCFSHILFTAPLSERCFKLDGAREASPPSPPVPCTQAVAFSQREMHNHAMLTCNCGLDSIKSNKLKSTTRAWNALCRDFLTCLRRARSQCKHEAVFTQL